MDVSNRSNIHLARAEELLSQWRVDQAIDEVRRHFQEDPNDPLAHAIMARAEAHRGHNKEALKWAESAVHLAPDLGYCHYIRAFVLARMDKLKEAEASAVEALRINPFDPNFYCLLGQIRGHRSDWKGAVEAAEAGLALEAAHTGCANVRAMALLRQGKKDNAEAAIQSALANDPEDAASHTSQGWICLNRGERDRALEHFREALRLDPRMDMAREGVLEALRTKYPIYRVLFSYYQWMSRFNVGVQRGIIVGAFVAQASLRVVLNDFPAAGSVIMPLLVLYAAFVFLTWTGRSTFDVLLRFNPLGRLALTYNQVVASNWVGGCLVGAIVSLCLLPLTQFEGPLLSAAAFALLAIPASRLASLKGNLRVWNWAYAGTYAGLIGLAVLDVIKHDPDWLQNVYLCIIVIFVAFTWIVGVFRSR